MNLILTFVCIFCVVIGGEAFSSEHDINTTDFITAKFEPSSLDLVPNSAKNVSLLFSRPVTWPTEVTFTYALGDSHVTFTQRSEIVRPLQNFTVENGTSSSVFEVMAVNPGFVTIGINESSPEFGDLRRTFFTVTVVHSHIITIAQIVIGWIYFVAWSISFYPQIIENFRRKSVEGLNFDFVFLNLTGHFSYGVFNCSLFWSAAVQAQYFEKHPLGVNPVQANDVFFSIHATALCTLTLIQCFIYESGGQKTSVVCRILLIIFWSFLIISLFIAVGHVITWLQYLYFFSYVKLAITIIKYFPQAWMNFRRKSTVGWSIGNILLDFTGGMLSILQMCLIAYNTDDWGSIMGDPTKFGLGLFSVLFDIVFILQHYVFYRHRPRGTYTEINGTDKA